MKLLVLSVFLAAAQAGNIAEELTKAGKNRENSFLILS